MTTTIRPVDDPWEKLRPKTLSASRAKDFMKCPLAWKYRAVDRIKPGPTLETVRGVLLHQVLETLYGFPAEQRTLDRAVELLDPSWDVCVNERPEYAQWLTDWDGEPPDLFKIVRDLLAVYFALETPANIASASQEVPFTLSVGPVPIRGEIDRVDRAPNGAERIVDYKSGKKPLPAYEQDALWQLKLYAVARFVQTGRLPAKVRLVFLGERRGILEYDPKPEEMSEFVDEVTDVWQEMQSAFYRGHFPAKPSRLCDWCDFKPTCPAHTGGGVGRSS